ncbi:MAG: tetratricopeptide repeat protein [Gammaproteobacteria bacterium]|nr:tetratricopeptide repeat protein [Gammaproteobacteria bacterium]
MQPKFILTVCFSFYILGVALESNAAELDVLSEARFLLSNNQSSQAMELLEENMEEHAGVPAYDFLLGKAALASKKPNLAVFALERVSLTKPDFYNARFLLGKAYLETGELDQATREFNLILNSSNKESLREASQRYLHTIRSVKAEAMRTSSLSFTVAAGYDSNANNATADDQFLGFTLSDESKAKESALTKSTLAGSFSYSINRRFSLHTNAQLFKYDYIQTSFVNTLGGAVSTRISRIAKTNKQSISADYQHVNVDGKLNSKQLASSFSHYQSISNTFSIRGTLRGAQTNFRDEYKIKDFRVANGGLQFFHFAKTKQKESITTSLSFIAGKEEPILSSSPYGRKYTGALLGLNFGNPSSKNSISTNLTYTYSKYDNHFFGMQRKDKSLSFSTQLNLKPVKNWTLGPQFRVMRTRSPIGLYEYDKMQLMLLVSRLLV